MLSPETRAAMRAACSETGARQARLDALVRVAEALLQAHHGLAACREAKVTGLDDAGMDRADRNLVQARPLGLEEAVRRATALREAARCASGACSGQRSVIEPRPPIGQPDHLDAEQIGDRALEAQRGRMEYRERGRGACRAHRAMRAAPARGGLEQRTMNRRRHHPIRRADRVCPREAPHPSRARCRRRPQPAASRDAWPRRGSSANNALSMSLTRAASPRDGTRR